LYEKGIYESGILKGMPKDNRLRLIIYTGILLVFIFIGFTVFILMFYHGEFDIIYIVIIGSIFCILSVVLVAFPIFMAIPIDNQTFLGLKRERISFLIGAMIFFIGIPMVFINVIFYYLIMITGILFMFFPFFMVILRIKNKLK
jgi:hypothetical protein